MKSALGKLGVVVCLFFVSVHAQSSVVGKWAGEEILKGSSQAILLELRLEGTKLTGSITRDKNPPTPISEGKVDGPKVTFKTTIVFNGNEVQVNWVGEVKGDQLSVSRQTAGGLQAPPLILKRTQQS
jgi:hypothetical protein